MPMALPLIGAAFSVGAGIAAGATTLIGGAMIAGGALTAIGALTGNKRLQQFGGIVSLAGGIGGMVTGAWSNTASSLANEAAREGSAVFGNNPSAYIGGSEAAAAGSSGMQGMLSGMQAAGAQATGAAGSGFGGVGMDAAIGGPGQLSAPAGMASTTGVAPSITPYAPEMMTRPAIPVNGPSGVPPGGAATAGWGGILGDRAQGAMSWMKANPILTMTGAGLLQGPMSAYAQQEAVKEQMRMQDEQQKRARDRLNASVQGLRMPVWQKG